MYVFPEDEKGEQANVCAHTLALSLSLSYRLTAFDLLVGVYSERKKQTRNREKKERKKNEGMAFSRCDGTEKN
jgi:hypothetical protein